MIQLIFMVIGIVYLFKLIGLNKRSGSHLGLDAESLAKWQEYRRKQYKWMIGAGWGSFGVSILITAIIHAMTESGSRITQEGAVGAQIAIVVLTLIVMIGCYSVSAKAGREAKALESLTSSR
jgi:hypothetical protein